jgi:hypothetical protein
MADSKIVGVLNEIALALEKCADEVPYELSAKDRLYSRMMDLAKEARELAKEEAQ